MDITERRAPRLSPKAEGSRASLLSLLTDAGTAGVDEDDLAAWQDRRRITRLERVRLVRDLIEDGEAVRAGSRWHLRGKAPRTPKASPPPAQGPTPPPEAPEGQDGADACEDDALPPGLEFLRRMPPGGAQAWADRFNTVRVEANEAGDGVVSVQTPRGREVTGTVSPFAGTELEAFERAGRPVTPVRPREAKSEGTATGAARQGLVIPGLTHSAKIPGIHAVVTYPTVSAKDITDLGERAVAKVDPAQGAYPGPGTLAARVLAFLREAPATTATVVAHFGAQGVVAHSVRGALGTLKARGFLEQGEVTRLYYATGKERGS